MRKLQNIKDIWSIGIEPNDIKQAIDYATVSLPWTFDRMQYGLAKQKGMNRKLINIMKGVLNQTVLERVLHKRGYKCSKDWTNYRQSDVFDFAIGKKVYDVKTAHVYSEYSKKVGRQPFSPKLLIKHSSYPGPDWKIFFPMCITVSQISPKYHKDGYIFGITETWEDINKIQPRAGDKGFWCSVPFGQSAIFFHNRLLINAREDNKQGFNVKVDWKEQQQKLLPTKKITITVFGESNKKRQIEVVVLTPNAAQTTKKEFSSVCCVKCDHPTSLGNEDYIEISVINKFKQSLCKPSDPLCNLNEDNFTWRITKDSFTNLRMPDDYKVYWIGFITPKEFYANFKKYNCYFIPLPGREHNQDGRLTPKMKEKFENLDRRKKSAEDEKLSVVTPFFCEFIKGNKFNAGLLIAQQKGLITIGAASYIYPPQPGAFPESAIYILPCDLYVMDDLK